MYVNWLDFLLPSHWPLYHYDSYFLLTAGWNQLKDAELERGKSWQRTVTHPQTPSLADQVKTWQVSAAFLKHLCNHKRPSVMTLDLAVCWMHCVPLYLEVTVGQNWALHSHSCIFSSSGKQNKSVLDPFLVSIGTKLTSVLRVHSLRCETGFNGITFKVY